MEAVLHTACSWRLRLNDAKNDRIESALLFPEAVIDARRTLFRLSDFTI